RADAAAVTDEVSWVGVRRGGIILRGEPVVEAEVAGCRLHAVELAVEVPLAGEAGRITGHLDPLRDGGFGPRQEDAAALRDPVVYAHAVRVTTGKQRGT